MCAAASFIFESLKISGQDLHGPYQGLFHQMLLQYIMEANSTGPSSLVPHVRKLFCSLSLRSLSTAKCMELYPTQAMEGIPLSRHCVTAHSIRERRRCLWFMFVGDHQPGPLAGGEVLQRTTTWLSNFWMGVPPGPGLRSYAMKQTVPHRVR
jgi:hypothetical protein